MLLQVDGRRGSQRQLLAPLTPPLRLLSDPGGVGEVRALTADAGRGTTLGTYSATRSSKAAGVGPVSAPHTEGMEGRDPRQAWGQ